MVAHCFLTVVYVVAGGLGLWGIWLSVKAVWVSVDHKIVFRGDGTAVQVAESFELGRIADLWRRWGDLPDSRRAATAAQIVIAVGVVLGAVGNIASLWWT